jgi:hypothetical protein
MESILHTIECFRGNNSGQYRQREDLQDGEYQPVPCSSFIQAFTQMIAHSCKGNSMAMNNVLFLYMMALH